MEETEGKRVCRSQSRCGQITCAICARRYAGHMAKRIADDAAGKLYAVQIELTPSSLADFWRWRVEARNLIDYRRRDSRWWRSLGLHVWLCHDSKLRGILTIGSLTETEVLGAFNRRWPTTFRNIDPDHMRKEIAAVVSPDVIMTVPLKARYQGLKLSICPMTTRRPHAPKLPKRSIEPMPVLI